MPQTGAYRTEVVLDPDSAQPVVFPARDDDGHLGFYTLERRTGGMALLVELPEDALRSLPDADDVEGRRLANQVKSAARAMTRRLAAGDIERQASIEELQARLEAQGEVVEDLRRRLAETERELGEAPKEAAKVAQAARPKQRTERKQPAGRAA